MSTRLAQAIKDTAAEIGVSPQDLATVMSYETGGTFDEWKAGPKTQHGQHRGLIQWGEPQARQYGVYKGMPVEGQVQAAGKYLVDRGVRPGHGLMEIYSAINAGSVGLNHRSDANNGGAPGTVADKVNTQMEGHKAKGAALLGGEYIPVPTNPYETDGTPDGAPVNYETYQQHKPAYMPSQEDVTEQEAAAPKPYDTYGEQLVDSGTQNWYAAKIARYASEGGLDINDTGWTQPQWAQISEELPEQYHDYVLSGSSEYNRNLRLKYAHEMVERDGRAAASGVVSSLTADLLSGIADPALLPLAFISRGASIPAFAAKTVLRKVVFGAAVGGTSNAALELGAKYAFDDPHTDALMAFGVGSVLGGLVGPLARNPATRVEAGMMEQLGHDAMSTAKSRPIPGTAQPIIMDRSGSGGATRNIQGRDTLVPQDWGIDDTDVDRGFGGKLRIDAAGQLTTDANPRARLAGFAIFDETAGTKNHSVIQHSASIRASSTEKQFIGNLNAVFQPAMHEYVKEGGEAFFNMTGRAKRALEFRHLVNEYTNDPHPSPDTNKHVVTAAKARQEFYKGWETEMKRVGLGGDMVKEGNYSPKVSDHFKIAELDRQIDAKDMEAFISQAIREAHGEIDASLVKRMSKGYWNNIRRAGYGIEDSIAHSLGLGDRVAFKQSFRDSLDEANMLGDEELEKVFDLFSGMVDKSVKVADNSSGISRLKRRTVMDYRFSAPIRTRDGGSMNFRMDDLFIQDAEFLDRRYARSMSGRVAFADTKIRDPKTDELIFDGIKNSDDLTKLKNWVKEGYRLSPGGLDQHKAAMETAMENIDFGWAKINGIPVYGQETNFAQWVRRAKTLQFIRLMSNMGLNQVQESWKIAAMSGFRAAASQLPSIRTMVNDAGRSVPKRDALLEELQHMTGTGLDGLFGRLDFRFDDDRIGASTSSWLGNKVDTALDYGQRLTAEVSLMRSINDYQQKWAAKAISQNLYNMARKTKTDTGGFDLGKLNGAARNRLATAGIGDKEAEAIFGNMLKHSTAEGTKLTGLGSKSWDPEVVTQFSHTVNKYVDRLVQRNDAGGLHRWMSKPVASMFVQFRSFVIGAWAKSTLYSINHMDPRMMVMLTGELAFGTATYAVRSLDKVTTDEGMEKYWEEMTNPVTLAKNGLARTATSSVLPMLMDSALMMTPVGAQFGSARASGAPQDAFFGAPVAGHATTIGRFSKGLMSSVYNDREMTKNELKAGYQAFVPLGNFIPFTMGFSALIEDKPDNASD